MYANDPTIIAPIMLFVALEFRSDLMVTYNYICMYIAIVNYIRMYNIMYGNYVYVVMHR